MISLIERDVTDRAGALKECGENWREKIASLIEKWPPTHYSEIPASIDYSGPKVEDYTLKWLQIIEETLADFNADVIYATLVQKRIYEASHESPLKNQVATVIDSGWSKACARSIFSFFQYGCLALREIPQVADIPTDRFTTEYSDILKTKISRTLAYANQLKAQLTKPLPGDLTLTLNLTLNH